MTSRFNPRSQLFTPIIWCGVAVFQLHPCYSCWHSCGDRVVTQNISNLLLVSFTPPFFPYAMYYQLNYLWHFPLGWFYYCPLLTFARNIFISFYCYGHRHSIPDVLLTFIILTWNETTLGIRSFLFIPKSMLLCHFLALYWHEGGGGGLLVGGWLEITSLINFDLFDIVRKKFDKIQK